MPTTPGSMPEPKCTRAKCEKDRDRDCERIAGGRATKQHNIQNIRRMNAKTTTNNTRSIRTDKNRVRRIYVLANRFCNIHFDGCRLFVAFFLLFLYFISVLIFWYRVKSSC